MTELSTTGVLEKIEKLNKLSEVSQVALGYWLSVAKETKAYEPEFSSFDEYYKTLGRSKGDISKLLKVGNYLRSAGFLEETVPQTPYTLLYTAISAFPDKDPEYVLAAASSNSISEMLENKRDFALPPNHTHSWEPARHCTDEVCGKYERRTDDELCDSFQEYLQRNDEWRGSSKSIANELRTFLTTNHA